VWSRCLNQTELRHIKHSQGRWEETSVPQSGEQISEAPTKESSPGKEKEECEAERAGIRRRRQRGFHGPLEATSVTLLRAPCDFMLDTANSLSPSCFVAVVSRPCRRHASCDGRAAHRGEEQNRQLREGEAEEAGSRERVAEEAGTEMSDKKRVDSEGDDEEDDEGSEDASMKGP
jgi:hypothetical protein